MVQISKFPKKPQSCTALEYWQQGTFFHTPNQTKKNKRQNINDTIHSKKTFQFPF